TLHQQPHGHGRRVPAAGDERAKECRLRGLGIEVKRLRIELRRECTDLLFIHHVRAAHETLADAQVVEVDGRHHFSLLLGRCLHGTTTARSAVRARAPGRSELQSYDYKSKRATGGSGKWLILNDQLYRHDAVLQTPQPFSHHKPEQSSPRQKRKKLY